MLRRFATLLIALTAVLATAVPASASLSDEVRAGQTLARQLQAGKTNCSRFATDDFEHLGEYAMNQLTGSLQLHGAMNERMRSFMGADSEQRMHVLMGKRYAGCASRGTVGPMMMDARGWDWMRDGNWQHMSRADWERVGDQWMGSGMMRRVDGGWQTRDYLVAGAGLVLVAGLLGGLLAWRWGRRRSAATP